ncbi:MAG: amidohydrolase family protein [Acidobacteria bacterium]|nr:amidohydrolase family protein [Acidobacteriota bacterium]
MLGKSVGAAVFLLAIGWAWGAEPPARWSGLREVNPPAEPSGEAVTAIVGATLIDGRGGEPLGDSVVVVRGARIVAVGPRASTPIPAGAERVEARGLHLLPGQFDTHFHSGETNGPTMTAALLDAGVTSFRDPGHPDTYGHLLETSEPRPRAFLTGKHLDQPPPAYPDNSILLQTADQTRATVDRLIDEGASAIKVYFRLPVDLIREAAERAHRRGVPVTAHLELVRADAAIRAGLDGIEHVTSLGTVLATPEDAETFERGVDAANEYRRDGRYWLWSRLELENNPRVQPLLDLMVERGTYLTPTLYTFEVREGDKDATPEKIAGFRKMVELVGVAYRAGVPILACSHGRPPEANWRDIELIVQAGVPPLEALRGATDYASRFFGAQDRLGTIEAGKLADLVLLGEDPTRDIGAVRSVRRVMLNGRWVR